MRLMSLLTPRRLTNLTSSSETTMRANIVTNMIGVPATTPTPNM